MDKKPLESPCLAPKDWNIFQRINWVRSQIGYVQKTKTVTGHGYKAVTHDEVTAELRPHLIKAGIVSTMALDRSTFEDTGQKTKTGIPIYLYTGHYYVTIASVDNPDDRIVLPVEAQANDTGDKAPGKCGSYAKKTVYLKVFDLETGEDEESRIEAKHNSQAISDEQAADIVKRIDDNDMSMDKFLAWLQRSYKVDSIEGINTNAYKHVSKQLDDNIAAKQKREQK